MIDCLKLLILMIVHVSYQCHVAGTQVLHIRGITPSMTALYSPDRDFECLDGSLRIPYTYVNDDYCDCGDGSDEPGTAACSNGSFYCRNAGHQGSFIPSAWVNDGFCDCCDASDEFGSGKECVDNCHELGKEARLEAQKAAELAREGSKIRQSMITRGKQIKGEFETRLVKLRTDYEEAELTKKEKEALKTQAEVKENIALQKYKPAEPEHLTPETKDEDDEHENTDAEAEEYFKLLDSDNNGIVSLIEIQTRATFDKDRNGIVTEEEALYFLSNQKELTLQEFIELAWSNIKVFAMLERDMYKRASQEEHDISEETVDHNKEEEEEEEEEIEADNQHPSSTEKEHEELEPEVHYDEETQMLIDEANSARDRFNEAEKAVQDLLTEIRIVEEKIERDYGTEEEFASLDGECFEYTDLEYVYSLCFFGKATQSSKSGGGDVSLGHWQEWIESEGNKYSKMKYDRGLTCWNGPSRSTVVTLICGKENKIVSVTEPSRCEYAMEFSTPAVCNLNSISESTHDEL
ncbi:glucosidase 2 subunit beta [Orussus abietinus]|uniref:glucosidase 2 subunit beta n=1 Tax=Orussus abietinus TaxID=222816 RepID=UPI0006259B6E|nr:glucosidase 2 subunit beta [Orussus abietinus]